MTPGEGREPRTGSGQDLLDYLNDMVTLAGREDILDLLDRTLEEARADEREQISFQLGLVAGEGYRGWRELQDACEQVLLRSKTLEEIRDRLVGLVAESKAVRFSEADG